MATPSASEISAAVAKLRALLEERTGRDYGASSVLGDLVVDAHGIIYGDLRALIEELRQRQSVRQLATMPETSETLDALEGILSNLFVSRDYGKFARASGAIHLTAQVDTLIPASTRFFRTASLVYYLDTTSDLLIPASLLRPVRDSLGRVVSWSASIPLVAAMTGESYNVRKGTFLGVDPFTPYLAYVENTSDFVGGVSAESAAARVGRTDTALSVRSLVNDRSYDATLRNEFSVISHVTTVGYGDPEMSRDRLAPGVYGVPHIHTGGHVDVFVRLPIQEVTETVVVGALTPRADQRVLLFRDTAPPAGSFVTAGVRVGDVLSLGAGLPEAPAQFKVVSVFANELEVARAVPFSVATDEQISPPALTYSIGDNYPLYTNHVASTVSATATTSRSVLIDGCAILPGRPTYNIKRVEVLSPPPALASFVDPLTGTVTFGGRRNLALTAPPPLNSTLTYRVVCTNPEEAQSSHAIYALELGWPGEDLAGTSVLVTYETLSGFDTVSDYVRERSRRILAANALARAEHPIYVSARIPYRPRSLAGTVTLAAADESTVLQALVNLIEGSVPGALDTTVMQNRMVLTDGNIQTVFPFEISYALLLPDGRVANYITNDVVTLVVDATRSTARLSSPTELGLPPVGYEATYSRLLSDLGVSDRVVRYRVDSDNLTLERRG